MSKYLISKVIQLIIIIVLLSYFGRTVNGRKFSRCELVKELLRRNVTKNEILEWVCIAEFESSFNTKAINRKNVDSSWDWGLFQINDRYWCSDGQKQTSNLCKRSCRNFLKNNIASSFECAKLIKKVQGLTAWVAWNVHCQGYVPTANSKAIKNEQDLDQNKNSDSLNNEEEGETDFVEKAFKFEDFAKRLVNPKVVRACTVILSDWEKIATKSLKAAVTILHRIAYGSHCPAMLYQAYLFRIFQRVLNAPREAHHEELRRLAIYVVRKFVEIAPTNPKIYSELLFYKTVREANELETGYCDNYDVGTKGSWSQDQEDELRLLFEENQRNPETDKDVIDWILDNLIDKTRTRRGVLKKLKDMGLMFKAPTKKSSAAGSKKLWQREEDEQLIQLYDQHRLDEKCLNKIVQVMGDTRPKNSIVKRLLELHVIADKSEIMPSRKGKKSNRQNSNSSDSSDSDSWLKNRNQLRHNLRKSRKQVVRQIVRIPLDVEQLKMTISELNEKFASCVGWLIESFEEACKDVEQEASIENEDNDVPLFPITDAQIRAMEDENFKKLLSTLGMKPPQEEVSTYWRIPCNFKLGDLKLRIKVLRGDQIEEGDIAYKEVIEYESTEEVVHQNEKYHKVKKMKHGRLLDKLIKKSKKQNPRKIFKNPLDAGTVRSLLLQIDDKFKEAITWLVETFLEAAEDTEEANNEEDGIPILPMLAVQKDAIENEGFKKLLIALGVQPPIQEKETYWRIPTYLKSTDLKKRVQILCGEVVGEIDDKNDNESQEEVDNHNTNSEDDTTGKAFASSDDGEDLFNNYLKNRQKKMTSLVYHRSDDDDDVIRKPLKKKPKRKLKIEINKSHDKRTVTDPVEGKGTRQKAKFNIGDILLSDSENLLDSNLDFEFDSENLRLRLAELSSSSEDENFDTLKVITKKKKLNVIVSDDESLENVGTSHDLNSKDALRVPHIETTTSIHHQRRRLNVMDSDSESDAAKNETEKMAQTYENDNRMNEKEITNQITKFHNETPTQNDATNSADKTTTIIGENIDCANIYRLDISSVEGNGIAHSSTFKIIQKSHVGDYESADMATSTKSSSQSKNLKSKKMGGSTTIEADGANTNNETVGAAYMATTNDENIKTIEKRKFANDPLSEDNDDGAAAIVKRRKIDAKYDENDEDMTNVNNIKIDQHKNRLRIVENDHDNQ